MAIKLTNIRYAHFERMIDSVLTAVAAKEVTLAQAKAVIAHVFLATAMGEETEVHDWLDPPRIADWKEKCRRVNETQKVGDTPPT